MLCLLWFWFDSLRFMVSMDEFVCVVCLELVWFLIDCAVCCLIIACLFGLLVVNLLFTSAFYRLIVLLSFVGSFWRCLVYSLLACCVLRWLLWFGLLLAFVMFDCRVLFACCLWLLSWFTCLGWGWFFRWLSGLNLVFVWLLRVYLFPIVSCWLLSVVCLLVICLGLILVAVLGVCFGMFVCLFAWFVCVYVCDFGCGIWFDLFLWGFGW